MKKLFIIIFLLFCKTAFANNVELSEISFKDNTSDWIEITINGKLESAIEIKDDKTITTIFPEQINQENFIIIHFKSKKEEIKTENNVLHIHTTLSGLTGTTEQITIESESKIIDAVCWENSSPTKSEQKDMEKLLQSKAWNGKCIDSEEIKNKQSIIKTGNNDTASARRERDSERGSGFASPSEDKAYDNKENWQISPNPTPGEKNKMGDLSTEIFINEIFPNPSGKDSGKEWIELYNNSEKTVNLGNWKINNGKSFTIQSSLEIKPKSFLILEKTNLEITLNNTSGKIELLDFTGKIIDKVDYKKTKENLSFSKILIEEISPLTTTSKNEWKWTSPTKNSKNQPLYKIKGKILNPPTENQKKYSFEITDENTTTKEVLINPEKYKFQLIKTLFKKGTKIEILVEKIDNSFNLAEYKIKNNPENAPTNQQSKNKIEWYIYFLFPIILGGIVFTYIFKSTPD